MYYRYTLSLLNLNGLVYLNIHREVEINVEEVPKTNIAIESETSH